MKAKYLVLLLLFAVVLVSASELVRTDRFPDFTLKDMSGNDVSLADFQGKPVILTFWATWCRPCRQELERMKPIYSEIKDRVHFIAINEDGPRSRGRVAPYINRGGFEYTFVYDDNRSVMTRAGVSDLPELFILDPEGYIVYRHRGYRLGNELKHKEVIMELLESLPEPEECDEDE